MVVLTYNSAATIGAGLEALVHQHYKDFEVIIVDDHSTDKTRLVASGYSSELRLSVMKERLHNIARGRNIGIKSPGPISWRSWTPTTAQRLDGHKPSSTPSAITRRQRFSLASCCRVQDEHRSCDRS